MYHPSPVTEDDNMTPCSSHTTKSGVHFFFLVALKPTMVADPLSSSEAFIRAIKSNSDPPVEGGLTKIELATKVVSRNSLYIPAKNEIVAEWTLSRLFKDRKLERYATHAPDIEKAMPKAHTAPARPNNPALDARYWKLLAQVVTGEESSSRSKPASAWLQPLLLKYPFLSLVSAVVRNAPFISEEVLRECHNALRAASSSVSVKFSYESAWELFVDLISIIAEGTKNEEYRKSSWLWTSSAQDFTTSVGNICGNVLMETSHKKKVSRARHPALKSSSTNQHLRQTVSAFVNGPLCTWLSAQSTLQTPPSSSLSSLSAALSSIVSTILFSPDILRQQLPFWSSTPKTTDEPSTSSTSHLNRIFNEGDMPSVLDVAPSVFKSFVTAVQTQRSTLFLQQQGGERLSPKIRAKKTCVKFLQACLVHVDSVLNQFEGQGWVCIGKLLQVAEEGNLVTMDNVAARTALIDLGGKVVSLLSETGEISPALFMLVALVICLSQFGGRYQWRGPARNFNHPHQDRLFFDRASPRDFIQIIGSGEYFLYICADQRYFVNHS